MQTCLKSQKALEFYNVLRLLKKYRNIYMSLSKGFFIIKAYSVQVFFSVGSIHNMKKSAKRYYNIEINDFRQFLLQLKISKRSQKTLLFRVLDGVLQKDIQVLRMIMSQGQSKVTTTYPVQKKQKLKEKIYFKRLNYYKKNYDLVFRMHDSCFIPLKKFVDNSLQVKFFFKEDTLNIEFFTDGTETVIELEVSSFHEYQPQNLRYILEQQNCKGIVLNTFDFQTFLSLSLKNRDCFIYCFLQVKRRYSKLIFYGKSRKNTEWHQVLKVYLNRNTLIHNQFLLTKSAYKIAQNQIYYNQLIVSFTESAA